MLPTSTEKSVVLKLLQTGNSPSRIIEEYSKDPVRKGYVGETILDSLICCGVHPTDPSGIVKAVDVDTKHRRIADRDVLKHMRSPIKSGDNKTDVAFVQNDKPATISVISSKLGMNNPSWNELGVDQMRSDHTTAGGYLYHGKNLDIVIYALVADKNVVLEKKNHHSSFSSRDGVTLLDISDLDRMHKILMQRIASISSTTYEEIVRSLTHTSRVPIRTRLQQMVVLMKINRLFVAGEMRVLLGALPRFGKTYVAAGAGVNSRAILVLTTRPTETVRSWYKVFTDHSEYDGYTMFELGVDSLSKIAHAVNGGSKCVVVGSLQFFKAKEDRPELVGIVWNLAILDEIHEGGATELSEMVIKKYVGNTRQLMLTATYTKPVLYYGIPEKCCIFWDLEDNRLMRTWADTATLNRLREKHGDDILLARDACHASGESDDHIRETALSSPELMILTTTMQDEKYRKIREMIKCEYGFSNRALFMPNKEGTSFQNEKAVRAFFQLLSGANKEEDYPEGDMSMIARIKRLQSTKNHRPKDDFLVAMCFLPYGVGQKVDTVKKLFTQALNRKGTGMENFATMNLDSGMENMSAEVTAAVNEAREAGKDGLLLLTGNVGSLGVSLPEVDVAFLLHDMHSADLTYQQMLRVLTEMFGKTCGIVVDFSLWRTLTTLNSYAMSRGQSRSSSDERIHWCVTNLIGVDSDLWVCKESPIQHTKESIADALVREWGKMMAEWGTALNFVARGRVDLGDDQKELNSITSWLGLAAPTSKLEVSDKDSLSDGVQDHRSEGDASADEKEEKLKPERQPNLNEILARLVPEVVVLSSCEKDLLAALTKISLDARCADAMGSFMSAYMNKTEDSENTIRHFMSLVGIVNRNYDKLTSIRDAYEGIATTASTIDNPKEMLTFLHGYLKPREVEKKLNGEVFTPPSLIIGQFEQLAKYCPDVWTNKDRKFLDGANGIGNYPAIAYTFLMVGLEKVIPVVAERKKHILENMIYMTELTPKNVEVSRKLFDPENKFKLNLICGDFTDENTTRPWDDIKFDVIMGNPPFQSPAGNRGSAQMLWVRFVDKYMKMLKDEGFMTLIHPGGWRLSDHKLLNPMRANQIHYLSIHDEVDGQKLFKQNTRYDWYVLQKKPAFKKTVVECDDKTIIEWDLSSLPFIPNAQFQKIKDITDSNDKVTIENSCCYMHNNKHVSKTRTDVFKYEVAYSVNRENIMTVYYASSNDRGTFGNTKVIWGSGATGFVLDTTGEVGLTQWCTGIADKKENLPMIAKVMNSKAFRPIIRAFAVGKAEINAKMMKFLNKDFYMAFIDEANLEVKAEPTATEVISKMTVTALIKQCAERNIKVPSKAKKADLVRLLSV